MKFILFIAGILKCSHKQYSIKTQMITNPITYEAKEAKILKNTPKKYLHYYAWMLNSSMIRMNT